MGFLGEKMYNLYVSLKSPTKINNKAKKIKNWYIMKTNNIQ
jgi:hypothetical protein